ncbi:oxidoreductase [Leptospira perolatii]|uniref:Oxidoreductase n=1 Tax=Leptospira perolatii TaxID=2023191 RepID=A0A2M9ZNC9_9LEPT|nr:aldo/keto reductase [Leptospira perolatii]PJZ69595.1 oxidoreductase [Leptospira perolatii]PJZ73582.1 oxidoreductase [Leptospira perolatii]
MHSDKAVPTIQLKEGGPSVSRFVYGCWRQEADPKGDNPERILEKIETCLELGIHTFDHADRYGDFGNEEKFGKAIKLKPGIKDSITIVTKCGIRSYTQKGKKELTKYFDASEDHILSSAENSLKRLNVDSIDLLLIHRPDVLLKPEEVASALWKLRKSGKVHHFGVSNFSTSQFNLLQSALDFPLVTNQIQFHPLHSLPLTDGTFDQALLLGHRPMIWSPAAGGKIFSPKTEAETKVYQALKEIADYKSSTPDQILFAWHLAHPAGLVPVIGTNNLERLHSAARAFQVKLERAEWYRIWESGMTGVVS